jgi:hypothetical protein
MATTMKRGAKKGRREAKSAADLTGRRFGKWTVFAPGGLKEYVAPSGRKYRFTVWLCRCECGRELRMRSSNLIRRLSTQCHRCAHPKYDALAQTRGASSSKKGRCRENGVALGLVEQL